MKCEAYFIGAKPISSGRNLWIKQKGPRIFPRPFLFGAKKKTVGFGAAHGPESSLFCQADVIPPASPVNKTCHHQFREISTCFLIRIISIFIKYLKFEGCY
jgi:hypothetical protein